MFHTPPSKKHLKNQWRLQISSSMEKEYFVPMEKGKKKKLQKIYFSQKHRKGRNQSIILCPKCRRAAEYDCPES